MDSRQNDASRASHRQHFVHNLFHQLFCIVILRDLTVTGVSQRGDRVQRAITQELQPEFSFDVLGYSTRNTGANENIGQVRCSFGRRSDDQITACEMFHATGFGHRHRDVNGSWYGRHVRHCANLIALFLDRHVREPRVIDAATVAE